MLKVLEGQIQGLLIPPDGLTKPGPELFQVLGNCDINEKTIDMFTKTLQVTVGYVALKRLRNQHC